MNLLSRYRSLQNALSSAARVEDDSAIAAIRREMNTLYSRMTDDERERSHGLERRQRRQRGEGR